MHVFFISSFLVLHDNWTHAEQQIILGPNVYSSPSKFSLFGKIILHMYYFWVWVEIPQKMKINWVIKVKTERRAQKAWFRYFKHGISLYSISFMIVFVI